jgi:K+-sensing histidine kinase KdpD
VADRRTIGLTIAMLVGAAIGLFVAWALEITGHPSWSVLLMIICACAPSALIALLEREDNRPKLLGWRWRGRSWVKVIVTLLLVTANLLVLHAFAVNPRDYGYLPLITPIVLSAIVLGFGCALLAVVISTVVADYVYALPEYSFALTDWDEVAGLATFAMLGAVAALMINEITSIRD